MTKAIRLLLVEDNPADSDLIRETFEEGRIDIEVEVAVDGEAAIDYLLRRGRYTEAVRPDLIVLDLNLPKMDGRDVLSIIKSHDDLHSIPVVILSSSDAERDIYQSYTLGANCFVTKSISLEHFQKVLATIETFWMNTVRLPNQ